MGYPIHYGQRHTGHDGRNNMVAFDAENGDLLWHTRIGNMTNPPQTFMVGGKQYLLVASGDVNTPGEILAFALP